MNYLLIVITAVSLVACTEPQQKRKYLYDLQLLEQVRWSGDGLTPIPDSFATLVTVQAKPGVLTRYQWSAQGRERFSSFIQAPTGTLSARASDSLYYLVQQTFADLPTLSDKSSVSLPEFSDDVARRIEISTSAGRTKASITDGNSGHHTDVTLFLLRHSKKASP
ncbi:hypothetical protein [Hymenobacter swuensis]|uniref:hypothetical protein n=1 Tax=Hymenobacter swuensis TaxID=1446467 RepID=UPI0012DCEA1A|nr:hypothetical protein [Hymenobacter swuensis]